MNDDAIIFSLNVLLWFYLGYRFFTALAKRKVTDGASLHSWSIIFGCYLITVLMVDSIEMRMDGAFGGLPVSVLARTVLMFGVIYLYFIGMRRSQIYSETVQRLYLWLNPLLVLVSLALFGVFAATRFVSTETFVHLFKGIRDVALIPLILFILFPGALHLWRNEGVRAMKVHRVSNMILYGVCLVQVVSEIVWLLALYQAPAVAPALSAVERGSTYLILLLFLAMMLPLRSFAALFYPVRWLLYWRLLRLEKTVRRLSTGRPPRGNLLLRLTHPDELELAIYQKVIGILDRYSSLTDEALQKRIQQVIEGKPQFPQIAYQLAAIRS